MLGRIWLRIMVQAEKGENSTVCMQASCSLRFQKPALYRCVLKTETRKRERRWRRLKTKVSGLHYPQTVNHLLEMFALKLNRVLFKKRGCVWAVSFLTTIYYAGNTIMGSTVAFTLKHNGLDPHFHFHQYWWSPECSPKCCSWLRVILEGGHWELE